MTKKTKNIVSDFANNDMPAEVQEQFRCWLDEHAGGEAAEEQLLEEILDAIALVVPIRYESSGGTIFITRR